MALSVPIVPCVRFSGLLERIESFGYVNPGSGPADMRALPRQKPVSRTHSEALHARARGMVYEGFEKTYFCHTMKKANWRDKLNSKEGQACAE